MTDLLDIIQEYVPPPDVDIDGELKMLITQTESTNYFGRQLIGRISQGQIGTNDKVCTVGQDGEFFESGKISRIVKRYGMKDIELKRAYAGDIISFAGFTNSTVGHIVNNPGKNHVIESLPIDPPMLSLTLTLNDSPLKGNDGDKLTVP